MVLRGDSRTIVVIHIDEVMSEETLFELPAIEENRAPAPTSPGEARVSAAGAESA